MLVFARGLPDLTVYRNLATATTVVAVNPDASHQTLRSMADTLLEPEQRLELLAQLAEPERRLLLWRPPG